MNKSLLFLIAFSTLTLGCTSNLNDVHPFSANVLEEQIIKPEDAYLEKTNNELEVHTINLGQNGDSTLIKFGTCDILIDAGGTETSAPAILKAIDTYVDGPIEYMIFTHADSDHICNFYNPLGLTTWFNKNANNYVDTLIDFDLSYDKTIKLEQCHFRDTLLNSHEYDLYKTKREELKANFKIKNHFTASQCCHAKRGVTLDSKFKGAKNIFTLDNGSGEIAYLEILYNYFYDHSLDFKNGYTQHGKPTSADRNLISVCTLIKRNNDKFLFTGDLEEYDSARSYTRIYGESLLVENNKDEISDVLFFKAGHHGSLTSNSRNLLNVIRPQYISISCVIGGQHNFPNQSALVSMLEWTDYIYFTSIKKEENIVPFHGYIHFNYNNHKMNVTYSNLMMNDSVYDNEDLLKLRELSCMVKSLDFDDDVKDKKQLSQYHYGSTYIKAGHVDIVVGSGIELHATRPYFLNKVKHLCNDQVIDYLIIPNFELDHISDLVGGDGSKNGLLFDKYFTEITNLIIPSYSNVSDNGKKALLMSTIQECVESNKIKNVIDTTHITSSTYHNGLFKLNDNPICENGLDFSLKFLDTPYNDIKAPSKDRTSNSIAFTFTFGKFKYLNVGDQYYGSKLEEIRTLNSNELNHKIQMFQIPFHGYVLPNDDKDKETDLYKSFLKNIYKDNYGLDLMYGETYDLYEGTHPSKFFQSKFNSYYSCNIYSVNYNQTDFIKNYQDLNAEITTGKSGEPYGSIHYYDYGNLNSSSFATSYKIIPTLADVIA